MRIIAPSPKELHGLNGCGGRKQLPAVKTKARFRLISSCHVTLPSQHQGERRGLPSSTTASPLGGTALPRMSRLVRSQCLVLMRGEFGNADEDSQEKAGTLFLRAKSLV
jgi:hypothetical protein